jgi:hypothetical protein
MDACRRCDLWRLTFDVEATRRLHGIEFLLPFIHELLVGHRRQALEVPPLVHAIASVLAVRTYIRPHLVVCRRSRCWLVRPAHGALHAVGGRAALEPELNGLDAVFLLVVAHEVFEQGVRFLAGLMKAALLNLAVERVPFTAKAARPFLAGAWLAMNALGDGLPGMANRPHLGGDS